ncbi:MAG: ribbon-helix-helix protein, CopG family [Thermoleophilaceae bacterium]|nr:ribbon-helix-helix protein, CopG family [Thermoleophilaceae bacterium]
MFGSGSQPDTTLEPRQTSLCPAAAAICSSHGTVTAVAVRTQTLVQLNDDLIELLDARAASRGISRSRLIRDLLEAALADDRRAEISRRMIEGYSRDPQSDGRDAWGDLNAWTDENTRANFAALDAEEGRERW